MSWLLADGGEPADELTEEPEGSELSLSVCCRFRPSVADAGGEETGAEEKVVVPLHQRIQQVRASRPGISRAAALRLVMSKQMPAACCAAVAVLCSARAQRQR